MHSEQEQLPLRRRKLNSDEVELSWLSQDQFPSTHLPKKPRKERSTIAPLALLRNGGKAQSPSPIIDLMASEPTVVRVPLARKDGALLPDYDELGSKKPVRFASTTAHWSVPFLPTTAVPRSSPFLCPRTPVYPDIFLHMSSLPSRQGQQWHPIGLPTSHSSQHQDRSVCSECFPYMAIRRYDVSSEKQTSRTPATKALSYVWGAPEFIYPIRINGKEFPVTKSLFAFLQKATSYYPKHWIWIDALCINQDDVNEKNQQVKQMLEIYSSASLVLVWLEGAVSSSASAVLQPWHNKRSWEIPEELVETVGQVFHKSWLVRRHEYGLCRNLLLPGKSTLFQRFRYPTACISGRR